MIHQKAGNIKQKKKYASIKIKSHKIIQHCVKKKAFPDKYWISKPQNNLLQAVVP